MVKKNINDIFKFTKHLICYNSCQSGYKKNKKLHADRTI